MKKREAEEKKVQNVLNHKESGKVETCSRAPPISMQLRRATSGGH